MTNTPPPHRILLGICGSIAAYKAAYLARLLVKAGCEVRVVMTEAAREFVGAATFQAITDQPVRYKTFDPDQEQTMDHITLARWADVILIAPASANTIAQIAHGRGENLLTTLAIATASPIVMAPAMNPHMWQNPATRNNVSILSERGVRFIKPASGEHACGELGEGRMSEPEEIATTVLDFLSAYNSLRQRLDDKNIVITAGPTEEAIDPVRVITNHSSGKMGYALAENAALAGANVTLISGPVSLPAPAGVERILVKSTLEMHQAVMQGIANCDIFIGTAAVADYRPKVVRSKKIKKGDNDSLSIDLIQNPDIIADVAALSPGPLVVGFAAETHNVLEFARKKRAKKGMDIICANKVGNGKVFGSDYNRVTIIDDNDEHSLPESSKFLTAQAILKHISNNL